MGKLIPVLRELMFRLLALGNVDRNTPRQDWLAAAVELDLAVGTDPSDAPAGKTARNSRSYCPVSEIASSSAWR